ncbi:MAG TPA: 3-dehydro-L-gulonate 2-dehydrogenase [Chryseosolibacter sp.]
MTNTTPETLRVQPDEMRQLFYEILLRRNVPDERARKCADVFTENSADGVLSHGVNRFNRFVTLIDKRVIDALAEARCVKQVGALEQWHGHNGLGIINALAATNRAMDLASVHGLGCVALGFTNHWMRAGTYARQAALKGFAFMAWSNTIRNTPAWGAIDPRLGNNPLTVGIPNGNMPVVLDMAMSQFSYGALEAYKIQSETLPVYGGYDAHGKLTLNPADIIESRRTLPIGYWKGAGLSLLLDMLGAILSGGLSVSEVSKQEEEKNLTQVFIAFNLKSLKNFTSIQSTLTQIIADFKQATPEHEGRPVRYPGESVLARRQKSYTDGIEVNRKKWMEILSLAR